MVVSYYFRKQQSGVLRTHPDTGAEVLVPDNTDDILPYAFRPNAPLLPFKQPPQALLRMAPLWPQDSVVDVVVTVSTSFTPGPMASTPHQDILFRTTDFHINAYNGSRTIHSQIIVPESLYLRNLTLWGHFYVALTGNTIDPYESGYSEESAYFFSWPLTQYIAKRHSARTRNLLEEMSEQHTQEVNSRAAAVDQVHVSSYYHPNISLAFVPDTGVVAFKGMHPAVSQHLHLIRNGARDGSGANTWYCKNSQSQSAKLC